MRQPILPLKRTRLGATRELLALLLPAALFVAMASGSAPRSLTVASDPGPRTPVPAVLRICSDPNNLPFSNERGEGFENRIAQVIAHEMGATVSYTWWAQRRGFIRNTLDAGVCDVVLGMPAGMERALTTRPYYRSTYVFVSRADRGLRVRSFDDPILRRVRIGVQLVGDDYANTPPAHALSSRHIVSNVKGYTLYGNYAEANPPERIMRAVAGGDIDVAVVWGPLAGYFATREKAALRLEPVIQPADLRYLPFAFDIAIAVRKGDTALRDRLDAALVRTRPAIEQILDEYGIPRVSSPAAAPVS